jgi:hypothetical protein
MKRILKTLANLFITSGVILLFGTAGSSDINVIGMSMIINNVLVGLSTILIGYVVRKVVL